MVFGRQEKERSELGKSLRLVEAEEALRESEERYRLLFNEMLSGFALHEIVCDENGTPCDYRFLEVNPAFERLTGLSAEKIIGKTALEVLPELESYWIETFGKVALTGKPVHLENYSMELDRYYEVSAFSPKSGQFAVTFTDVTERKRAEEALREANKRLAVQAAELETQAEEFRIQTQELAAANVTLGESEERFHRLFEEDLTGDFLCTREGRILLCNPAFAAIFGFTSRDEAVGTSILALYIDGAERHSMMETIEQQGKLAQYQAWRKRRDGTLIHVVENLVGRFNDRGELYEIQGYVFDDTKRKRAEEAIRRLNETLEEQVAERTKKLAEANEQLRALALQVVLIEERERRSLAEDMHDSVAQSLALTKLRIDSLRNREANRDFSSELTSISAGLDNIIEQAQSLMFELSPPVLYQVGFIEALQYLAERMEKRHNIRITVNSALKSIPVKEDESVLLFRTVQELLTNTVKHAKASSSSITLWKDSKRVCIEVQDNGTGFDASILEAGGSLTGRLGLLSIRERLHHLGGHMQIESSPGDGTKVSIAVPLRMEKNST